MSQPMPDPTLGSQAIPTTPCDVCGIAFGPGDVWNYHARLGVYVHSKCAADFPVRGEDITTHTVLWGQIPETPSMTGPEVTAAMKAEDVDAALVDRAWNGVARAKAIHGPMSTHDVLRHALAAVLPEIQAQALRDAADGMYDHRHTGCFKMQCPDCREARVRADVRAYLKSRAARLTARTEEPK